MITAFDALDSVMLGSVCNLYIKHPGNVFRLLTGIISCCPIILVPTQGPCMIWVDTVKIV